MENIIEKPKVKVLFLASDPSNASRLHLGRELEAIRAKLANNISFEIKDHLATKPNDVMNEIMNYQPQIVHFSGHGSPAGELCFEDEAGLAKTISPEALASLFSLASDYVKCVVVNTCFAEKQARSIAQHIPVVVGTKSEISDEAAINFSTGFYTALRPDLSIESLKKAFSLGLIAIQFDGNLQEHLTPIIIFGSANLRFASEVDSAFTNISSNKANAVQTLILGLSFIGQKMGLSEKKVNEIIDEKLWRLKQYNSSIEEYEKNLRAILRDEFPLSESSDIALSYLQNGLNLSNDDVAKIREKILSDPKIDSAYSWYDRGIGQKQLGNYTLAIEYFTKALDKQEEYSAVLANRAQCYIKLEEYQKAIDDLTNAIELNKNWEISANLTSSYFDRGYCYFSIPTNKQENLNKAINDWKNAIELENALYNIGLAYEKLNNYKEAIEYYEKALESETSKKAETYTGIIKCYSELGNNEKIKEWSQKATNDLLPKNNGELPEEDY